MELKAKIKRRRNPKRKKEKKAKKYLVKVVLKIEILETC